MKFFKFKIILLTVTFLLVCEVVHSQEFASWRDNKLLLDNGFIRREITILNNGIHTDNLRLRNNDLNFCNSNSKEFSFLIDNKSYDGSTGWELISFTSAKDNYSGNGATINIKGIRELSGIELAITYLLYPGLPVIRKQITLFNKSGKEIKLESFDIDKLVLGFNYVESVVYSNYGRQKHLSTYIGNWDDPLLIVHSYRRNAGILLGNESPGVLKRIDYNVKVNGANIGLTHNEDDYPFRKYIKSGANWSSPRTFIIPYVNSKDPWNVMNTSLADFQRRHMGLRIFECEDRPDFMYNNYVPFYEKFNDTILLSVAKAASECGVKQFEIDWGWQTIISDSGAVRSSFKVGDWIVDKKKFPDGLQPFFSEIRKMGMVPGLWLSAGSAVNESEVYRKHPEWAVRNIYGQATVIHEQSDELKTMCFGTDWKDYIKNKIIGLVKEFNLKFVKLDYAVATSAYITEIDKSGCYAKDHPFHKDHEESFIVIYERLFELFDELHKELPDLYIDCTFETEGKLQLIDYAFAEHAEGNWLTNISEPFPVGAFRIRNLAWWKSPAVPASSLIIGNLQMNSPDFIKELKTLIGTFPIVLGDPRKLSENKKEEIKQWSVWIQAMRKKYDYDLYRQDIRGFGEPVEGGWDAWARINTEKKNGGIIGIYRQGSLDDERIVSVAGLDKFKQYFVRPAPLGEDILKISGKDLEERGFKVKIDELYDGKLFEIGLIN